MQPTRVEEKLIRFLSKITQEFHNSCKLGVISASFVVNALFVLLFSSVVNISSTVLFNGEFHLGWELTLGIYSALIVWASITLATILTGALIVEVIFGKLSKNFLTNTQEVNNPNKFTWWLVFCRMSFPVIALVLVAMNDKVDAILFLLILGHIGQTLALYSLCVNIPVTKKSKE